MNASQLRSDVYRVLDGVLETGQPVVIERGGRHLRIVAEVPASKLSRLIERRSAVVGDSDDFVSLDWSGDWQP